jgi:putative FmdB family regulatory protein
MPTYDYICSNCGKTTEIVHSINAGPPAACPACGAVGTLRKAFNPPTIHFKGSGWAKKDRSGGHSRPSRSSDSGSSNGSDSGSDGGDGEKRGQGDSGGDSSSKDGAASGHGTGDARVDANRESKRETGAKSETSIAKDKSAAASSSSSAD